MIVHTNKLVKNYKYLCAMAPNSKIAPVVKSNCYGFGMNPLSLILWDCGARTFFVASIEEGIELRILLPEAKIIILNGFFEKNIILYEKYKLIPSVCTVNSNIPFSLPIWLHFDMGLNRTGIKPDEGNLWKNFYQTHNIQGIMAHTRHLNHLSVTDEEITHVVNFLSSFPMEKSYAASSLLQHERAHLDIIRPGVALYFGQFSPLSNIAECFSILIDRKSVKKGENIGYGHKYIASDSMEIGIVDIGYAEGITMNHNMVEINGCLCPVVGSVSMNMMTVDISKISDCPIGTRVNLFPGGLWDFAMQLGIRPMVITARLHVERTYM